MWRILYYTYHLIRWALLKLYYFFFSTRIENVKNRSENDKKRVAIVRDVWLYVNIILLMFYNSSAYPALVMVTWMLLTFGSFMFLDEHEEDDDEDNF